MRDPCSLQYFWITSIPFNYSVTEGVAGILGDPVVLLDQCYFVASINQLPGTFLP
jgi:hypothetical protein